MNNTNESTTKDFSEMTENERAEAIAKIDKLLNTYTVMRSGLNIPVTEETKLSIDVAFSCLNQLVKRDEEQKEEIRKLIRNNPLMQKAFDLGRFSAKYLLGSVKEANKMYDCLVKDGLYEMPNDGYSMKEGNACFNELVKEGLIPEKKSSWLDDMKYDDEFLRDAGFETSDNDNSFWF